MALSDGINSYTTVEYADVYFSDRVSSAWAKADSASKAKALVTATDILDSLAWTGKAISNSQPLAFPRSGSYFDPKVGSTLSIEGIPQRIKIATMELAQHLLLNEGIQDSTGTIKDLTVGSISLTLIQNPSRIPLPIKTTIKPLLANGGSNTWWRAN